MDLVHKFPGTAHRPGGRRRPPGTPHRSAMRWLSSGRGHDAPGKISGISRRRLRRRAGHRPFASADTGL